jgi:hypothetical protein
MDDSLFGVNDLYKIYAYFKLKDKLFYFKKKETPEKGSPVIAKWASPTG